MSWSVQRQTRPAGSYYSALFSGSTGKKRGVTAGIIPGNPPPATLTARLREGDPNGAWPDSLVVGVMQAVDDDGVRASLRTHRQFFGGKSSASNADQTSKTPAPKEPKHPNGGMLLRDYLAEVWEPIRQARGATWARELWWWTERILPALGGVRLVDLDTDRWTRFLAGLTCGGRSKALCQTAYRVALTHAVEVLGWVEDVHRFTPVEGSTKRTLPDPEPLTAGEVETFLASAPSPVHRALFGTQIGQGLRPGEVIRVRWEDVDWRRKTLRVRGSKNSLASATVPLTPLTERELVRWWTEAGCPTSGVAFPRSRGGGEFPEYPRTAWRSTVKRSGLDEGRERGLFPYIARHSFATIAAVSGIDRAMTKAMMRHSRASTVLEEAYERVSQTQVAAAFSGFGNP